ncbi:hypothetical protein A7D00_0901 [Trichophyton violaceum]|uniref:Aminoglycoside phosphotransferase domain-containing protein n=1 Tax=Trichophyton violaceum TaxID=34388 RepID=A0A178FS65_TRIVO|nr:hypothetical protein A7D00_0901 [Trichophyton violaceum]
MNRANYVKLDWNSTESFFNYTRGRFVVNEAEEMRQRHVRFDMNELARLAANTVGAKEVVNIEKCADGHFNKAFVFTFEDGKQVVGKVPNPIAITPHLTTASEVATMEFMRTVLKTPTPQVHAWSSRVDDSKNSVGAEFIIMEKISGIPLGKVWERLSGSDKMKVLINIFEYQNEWASVAFSRFGSLYYSGDVDTLPADYLYIDKNGNQVNNPRFVVGPASHNEWFTHARDSISCDRGPWNTVIDYRKAIAHREITASRLLPFPRQTLLIYGPRPLYLPTVEKKVAALKCSLQSLETFLPEDPALLRGHLWHTDFHHENIHVNPEKPTEITGIIDWQSTPITPLFDQPLDLPFVNYDGPDIGENLEIPVLPDDFQSMQEDEKKKVHKNYMDKSAVVAWRLLLKHKNPAYYRAVLFKHTPIGLTLELSRQVFTIGESSLRTIYAEMGEDWQEYAPKGSDMNPVPCPFNFSQAEITEIDEDEEATASSTRIATQIQEHLGPLYPHKGVIEHENYEEVKKILGEIKQEVIEHLFESTDDIQTFDSQWPYKD